MKDRIMTIIKNENKYKPYTDEEISNQLGLTRELVALGRKGLKIEDSRERLRKNISETIESDRDSFKNLSERGLTKKLNDLGFIVSRYVIREIKKGLDEKKPIIEVKKSKKKIQKTEDHFSNLVGYDRSLGPIIKQAKAAMMYPPMGLHTLILGETGVGKSDLAASMFKFSKETKILDQKASLIIFNCADYADNPELLMSQIFGYKKGAFTGADNDKEGLVEKANNSILFLDEIHRLPPEGQEQLFYLIDKGKFRRLGETNHERTANLTIIAATTENPELTLLSTFRRRIPMVIEIPSLKDRPLTEKFDLIKKFIQQEALRINKEIKIENDTIQALLLFDCPGNLGQLKSEIQVACARSFLNMVVDEKEYLKVSLEELSKQAKQGLMQLKFYRKDIERIVGREEIVIYPGDKTISNEDESDYILPNEIYSYIEERYLELQNKYENNEIINNIIGFEIDKQLKNFVEKAERNNKKLNKEELINIFGSDVINLVEKIIILANTRFKVSMDNLYYVLAAHLSATINRVKQGRTIKNPQLEKIQKESPKEFQVALEIIGLAEKELDLIFPVEEAGFITTYLKMTMDSQSDEDEKRVGVIVASHGSVAGGMASVANKLLDVNHAKFMEMALDEKPESALERTRELVKKTDLGKGVLLLVDMGSLATFGEVITDSTGIPTRTLARTDTVLVIEAVRRAILPNSDLDEIADTLLEKNNTGNKNQFGIADKVSKKHLVITTCITGEGTSQHLKKALEKELKKLDIEIMALGVFGFESLEVKIKQLSKGYEILCVLGTIDPQINYLNFITVEAGINTELIEKIKNLHQAKRKDKTSIQMDPDLIFSKESFKEKEEIIQFLCQAMEDKGYLGEGYLNSVFERMAIAPFDMLDGAEKGIAVIHSSGFDQVYKNGLGVITLEKEIFWDRIPVDVIFLLGVKDNSPEIPTAFNQSIIRSESMMKNIRLAKNKKELLAVLNS